MRIETSEVHSFRAIPIGSLIEKLQRTGVIGEGHSYVVRLNEQNSSLDIYRPGEDGNYILTGEITID